MGKCNLFLLLSVVASAEAEAVALTMMNAPMPAPSIIVVAVISSQFPIAFEYFMEFRSSSPSGWDDEDDINNRQ